MRREQHNATYIETLSREEIKEMLLKGFSKSDFRELKLSPHIDIIRELNYAFRLLSDEHKEDFRQAIYLSLVESTPSKHNAEILRELAFLSAFVNAKCVIDYLKELSESEDLLANLEDEGRTQSVIMAVLRGFAKRKD